MPLLCVCVQALAGLDLMIRTSYSWCSLQHSPDPTAAEKILWDFANYSLFGFDVFLVFDFEAHSRHDLKYVQAKDIQAAYMQ